MPSAPVDPTTRLLAASVDGVIAFLPAFLPVPLLGGVLGLVYILFRDGLVYRLTRHEGWKDRSIGKKLFHLQVVRLDGKPVDLLTSTRRNLPLALGGVIALIPFLGQLLGPLVTFTFTLVELTHVARDPAGRRVGDRWANTQVVRERLSVQPQPAAPRPPVPAQAVEHPQDQG